MSHIIHDQILRSSKYHNEKCSVFFTSNSPSPTLLRGGDMKLYKNLLRYSLHMHHSMILAREWFKDNAQ